MNILIIGNGFDISHGLETSYDDFLTWAYHNNNMNRYHGFNLEGYWEYTNDIPGSANREYKDYIERNPTPPFIPALFKEKENEGWIDLENNLHHVIESIAEKREGYILDPKLINIFDEFLVKGLENYIAEAINTEIVNEKFRISKADKILSFNYSNTCERIYNIVDDNICYVNGKAAVDSDKSNIVFGCDFYDFNLSNLTKFNKIAQRVNNGADGKYRKWINYSENTENKIYIIGHSLGKTDWEIIRPFIVNEKNKTTVFYHSEESKKDLIHNMLGMVGRDYMINNEILFKDLSVFNKIRLRQDRASRGITEQNT